VDVVGLPGGVGLLGNGVVAEVEFDGSLRDFLLGGRDPRALAELPVRRRVPIAESAVTPVVGPASAVWGVGLNYRSKQIVTGRTPPEHPVLFVKGPRATATTTVPIALPAASSCVDFEGEVAVVIGAPLSEATASEARRAIAGVVAANDVTARDVMRALGSPVVAKSCPGFGQFGAVMRTSDAVELDDIRLRTWVNGALRQDDSTAGLLLPIPELLALMSRYTAFAPGDVVLTGTPAGTGDEEAAYLAAGDTVVVQVDDVEPLVSTVVGSGGAADPPSNPRDMRRTTT